MATTAVHICTWKLVFDFQPNFSLALVASPCRYSCQKVSKYGLAQVHNVKHIMIAKLLWYQLKKIYMPAILFGLPVNVCACVHACVCACRCLCVCYVWICECIVCVCVFV